MEPRLYPKKSSGRYFILTKLRLCNEHIIEKYFSIQNNPNEYLLDFGCGSTPYKKLYLPYLKKYLGADFLINKEADLYINEDGTLPSKDNSIDYVLSTQVLEHVLYVDSYLMEVKRVLKEQGILILSTHGYWKYHPNPGDYWRWTKDGLEQTISKNGFEIIETFGIMGLRASGLQLFQDGIINRLPNLLKKTFAYLIQFLQHFFDSGSIHQTDAGVFIIVAKLKA